MRRLNRDEDLPHSFLITWFLGIWKKNGLALYLKIMRYVYTKEWEAKLCEVLVTEHMKTDIIDSCPNIQIGGIKESSSTEHLITLKTWMKKLEEKNQNGVFQTFDLEKFFDKESLLNTMDTLKEEAKIYEKDYRLRFKINENGIIGVKIWHLL